MCRSQRILSPLKSILDKKALLFSFGFSPLKQEILQQRKREAQQLKCAGRDPPHYGLERELHRQRRKRGYHREKDRVKVPAEERQTLTQTTQFISTHWVLPAQMWMLIKLMSACPHQNKTAAVAKLSCDS